MALYGARGAPGQRAKKSLAGLGRYCGGLWRHRMRHWAPHLRHRCSGARWREWPRGRRGLPVGEYVRRLGSGGTVGQCWLQCSVLTPLRWDHTIAIVTINNPVHLNAHSRPSSFITPPRSVRDPLPVAQPTQGRRVSKKSLVNSPRETLIGISPRTSQMSISDPDFLAGLARPRTISANSTALLPSSVQRRRFNSLSMSQNPCSLPLRLNATCVSLGAANVAFFQFPVCPVSAKQRLFPAGTGS